MNKSITDPTLISAAVKHLNDAIDTVLWDEDNLDVELLDEGGDLSPECWADDMDGNASAGSPSTLRRVPSSYKCDIDIIRDLFEPKHYTATGEITHTLVMQRLSLIDLFYSASLNRFNQFGIYELANKIYLLSKDINGNHYDSILIDRAQSFVTNPSVNHRIYKCLFNNIYGIPGKKAVSIISKYLFFLLEVQKSPNGVHIGFPIYDSIVKKLLPKVGYKIGIPISLTKINNIVNYVAAIKDVAQKLGIKPRNGRSVFGVLDFFLWRIGKVGELSFSLLLTRSELKNCLHILKQIKQKGAQPALLAALPSRFQRWWQIHQSL